MTPASEAMPEIETCLAEIAGERAPRLFPKTSYEIAADALKIIRTLLPAAPLQTGERT